MEKEKKMFIGVGIFLGICFLIIGIANQDPNKTTAANNDTAKSTPAKISDEEAKRNYEEIKKSVGITPTITPTSTPKEPFELSNGNYVAGSDFPEGKYDFVAVKGNGNVSSSNIMSGGINAIMGVGSNEMYQKEYKNIKLPKGTELKITNVTIKMIQK